MKMLCVLAQMELEAHITCFHSLVTIGHKASLQCQEKETGVPPTFKWLYGMTGHSEISAANPFCHIPMSG